MKPLPLAFLLTMTTVSGVPLADTSVDTVRAVVEKMSGGKMRPAAIRPAPVPGWYEVALGSEVFYVTADGRYLFSGDLIEIGARRNLTEEARAARYKKAIERLDESTMIVYSPKKVKYTVTIFTDIDCPYCRKLHEEMDGYLKAGIKVRYLAFPRAGAGSESYKKAISVWCAEDRAAAMTRAKSGKPVNAKKCEHPLDEHMALVRELGVNATPTIFLENGLRIPGYVPPQRLLGILKQQAATDPGLR